MARRVKCERYAERSAPSKGLPMNIALSTKPSAPPSIDPASSSEARPRRGAEVEIGLAAWLLAASVLGASGLVSVERPFLVPLVLFGSIATLLVLHRTNVSFRALVDRIPTRVATALHVVRAPIGGAFLVLAAEGRLDPAFANLAGPGDAVAGVLAFAALPFAAMSTRSERRVVALVHVLGLIDIVAVVVTAQRILLFSGHPESMAALTALPWALLPTFLVPMVVVSHLLVLGRAWRATTST